MNTNTEDRDINQKLHEVMGRSKCQPVLVKRVTSKGNRNDYYECERCGWSALDDFPEQECPPKKYDSSLTDAFELVEWMRKEKGVWVTMLNVHEKWAVRFYITLTGSFTQSYQAEDASLPRAIALAAIRALEGK